MSNIKRMIKIEVNRLANCESRLPTSIDEIRLAGKVLIQMDDDLLKREHERYGSAPALIFMTRYACGLTPREMGI